MLYSTPARITAVISLSLRGEGRGEGFQKTENRDCWQYTQTTRTISPQQLIYYRDNGMSQPFAITCRSFCPFSALQKGLYSSRCLITFYLKTSVLVIIC
jgi:hypothetical protein